VNSTLLVPVEGLMELFIYDVDPIDELKKREQSALVSVVLNRDNDLIATVHYPFQDAEQNERATAITGLLCGSFVKVQGMAMFSGLSDEAATRIMREVG